MKTAVLFQNRLWEIVSITRPTARSLSATWATGYGTVEWSLTPVVPVWSVISHMNVRLGIRPRCSCRLNVGSHSSTRY